MFMTLRNGVQQLTEALIARCHRDALQSGSQVVRVGKQGETYRITMASGEMLQADAVVLALPAYVSADLVHDLDEELALQLSSIPYVSSATASFGFKRSEIHHPLDGYGFVVPRSEKRKIIACTWSSTKFHHRAPNGHVLIRAYVGGANREELAEQEDAVLIHLVREELRGMMGITADPEMVRVYHWRKANPQYQVGHKARVAAIEQHAAKHAGLYFIGSAYRGVGIPDCIADGARVAERILSESKVSAAPLRKAYL
jgi:oxygen-dependent protoporphyrinogen oxidase